MRGKIILKFLLLILVLTSLQSYSTFDFKEPELYNLRYDSTTLGEPFIPKSNPLTMEGVRLGRLLFYDPILSSNNEMSCGTCHIQEQGFTDGKKLAIGTYGDTLNRNTMSLVNLAWANKFFWDGRVTTLEELVREPIINPKEMAQDTIELVLELKSHKHYPKLFAQAFPNEEISTENTSKAVAQFLRTIVSNGLDVDYDSFSENDYQLELKSEDKVAKESSLRGSFVRFSEMCSPCHSGAIYGNMFMADNGVADNMKAPSLLNIMQTAPYMHDGRFKRLEEVLLHYQSHLESLPSRNIDIELSQENMLTQYDIDNANQIFELFSDTSVLTDPAFSNPFDSSFDWDSL